MNRIKDIASLVTKDLRIELRTARTIAVMVVLALLIAWIVRITLGAAAVNTSDAVAAILLAILFCSVIASDRIFEAEFQNANMPALLLSPLRRCDIFFAKLMVNLFFMAIFEIFLLAAVWVMFESVLAIQWLKLVTIVLLLNIGIAAVGTLFGWAAQPLSARSALLTVLLFALILPIMLLAVGGLSESLGGRHDIFTETNFNQSWQYLLAADIIFLTAGWLLSDFLQDDS